MKKTDFYFEKTGKDYFVSNESGCFLILNGKEFKALSGGKPSPALREKLEKGNFITDRLNLEKYFKDYDSLKKHSFSSPSLHILVLTLKCNQACRYCRAVDSSGFGGTDMSWETARKAADFILGVPGDSVTAEFQGGEALINWPVLKKTIEYLEKKNQKTGKDLKIAVVTNLTLMTAEKMKFLTGRGVSVCTSLDGPAFIHDRNRLYRGGSSHALAVKWLKKIRAEVLAGKGEADAMPSALMTTTRFSLPAYKEITDEYRNLGLGGIFIRPLSPIGYAKKIWGEIGYSPGEFLKFYAKTLDYVLYLNLKGERFVERNAAVKLEKMLFRRDPNFLDLRSPCGAAIGQLAYNYDGDIYTCDEGRMVGARGDKMFRVGNVFSDSYGDIISSQAARMCAMCSCLENQPLCSRCAFKPYCGVCPVHNYETSGTPWGSAGFSGWCETEKGIFRILSSRMKNPAYRKVFEGWFRHA